MATLADLEEQRGELEVKLQDGDLSVEPALARIDRAITSRKQKIAHSRKRLDAARNAVAAGMSAEEARSTRPKAKAKKKAATRGPLNRFE